MNVPISHSVESLERFFVYIEDAPIPAQVNPTYLKDNGFTSGHDPEIRLILRLLKFLTESDVPTQLWHDYREKGRSVLQSAVKKFYSGLFRLYPDAAFGRTQRELEDWFRPFLKQGARNSPERAVRTFKKLCLLSDIVAEATPAISPALQITEAKQVNVPSPQMTDATQNITHFVLPLSTDPAVYSAIAQGFGVR